jgi:hypothetical protein
MSIKKYRDIYTRADELLKRRGIAGHTAAKRFVLDFKAHLVAADATGRGDAEATISLLENDEHLTDSKILNTNFRSTLQDLISDELMKDSIFPELFRILMDNNGKGVGGGELALPLILSNYRFSNESDGVFDGDKKVEIKKNGASLKPVRTGVTDKGLVDQLNAKYWNGTVPGKKGNELFERHLSTVTDPTRYADYFRELYVGCDTESLAKEVIEGAYRDPNKFNTALGKFALREYQKVDGWNNIIYIDSDSWKVVNICDPSSIDSLKLNFSPVMRRGKDTQAIADGYVNVRI